MRSILAVLALVAATSPAAAACQIRPDGPATRYVENQQALVMCQNELLRAGVADRQSRLELDQQLRQLQSDFRNQQNYMQPILPRVNP